MAQASPGAGLLTATEGVGIVPAVPPRFVCRETVRDVHRRTRRFDKR
jgi:hypothetical protein